MINADIQQQNAENLSQIDEEISKQEVFLQHLKKVYGYRQIRCRSTGKIRNKPYQEESNLVKELLNKDAQKLKTVEDQQKKLLQNLNLSNESCAKSIELNTTYHSQEEQYNLSTNDNENQSMIKRIQKSSARNSPSATYRGQMSYIDILHQERDKLKQSFELQNTIKKRINTLQQQEEKLRRIGKDSQIKTYGIYSTKRRIFQEEQIRKDLGEYQNDLITIKNENVSTLKQTLNQNIKQSKQSLNDKQIQRGNQVRQQASADEERRKQELERFQQNQIEKAQRVREQLKKSQQAIQKFKEQKQIDYKKSYEQKLARHQFLLSEKNEELKNLQKKELELVKRLSTSKILTHKQNKILQHSYYHNVVQFGEEYPQIKKEYDEKNMIYNPNSSRSPSNEKKLKSQNSSIDDNNDQLRVRQSNNFSKFSKNQSNQQASSSRNLSPLQNTKQLNQSFQSSPKRTNSLSIYKSQNGFRRYSQYQLQML